MKKALDVLHKEMKKKLFALCSVLLNDYMQDVRESVNRKHISGVRMVVGKYLIS